jgi:hypothetical protein
MDEVTFSLHNERHSLSREQVDRALNELPEGTDDIRVWAVQVQGRRVPLKALFRRATGIDDFTPQRAASVLQRLGYQVVDVTRQPPAAATNGGAGQGPQAPTAAPANGRGDEARLALLHASVEYASTRPQMTAEDVVEAARTFERFIYS